MTGKKMEWLIQDCRQAVGNCALWWGPNRQGYVCSLEEAGRYTEEEAKAQKNSRNTDRAVRLVDAMKCATSHVRTDTNGGDFRLKSRRVINQPNTKPEDDKNQSTQP